MLEGHSQSGKEGVSENCRYKTSPEVELKPSNHYNTINSVISIFWHMITRKYHTYINLAVVCLSACLSGCPSVTFFQWIMARPNDLGSSPKLQYMNSLVSRAVLNFLGQYRCLHARTALEIVHAIFAYFSCKFFDILKPFLTENEKNRGHTPDRYRWGAPF